MCKTIDDFDFDLGDDLEITETTRRAVGAGTWASGTIAGHEFQALVFPEHAECESYELERSRISKLWVRRLADKKTVFNWDRGLDIAATTDLAQAIVDFLCAGLADHIEHLTAE
jgi:hypothetical protein